MAGEISFTIPITFAALPSPVPMAYLDQCFAAIQTALSGVAISSAGVTATAQGPYDVRGITGVNNAGTPNTQYDLAASLAVMRNPSTGGIKTSSAVSATCNILTAGPAANGRDVAGAFSANSWLHFYFIGSDSLATATLASTIAPPTGPTLPNGYTYWAYAGAVRYNATPVLVPTRIAGNRAYYSVMQQALATGTQTVETAVSVATLVPPNAPDWGAAIQVRFVNAGNSASIGVVSGTVMFPYVNADGLNSGSDWVGDLGFPNVAQQFYYSVNLTALDLWVRWYTVPNGA